MTKSTLFETSGHLDFYADDPATAVGLAYVEGIVDEQTRGKLALDPWR